jgi:hypothetical protein
LTYFFPAETQHVKSFFDLLAMGDDFAPKNALKELRVDTSDFTALELNKLRETVADYAKKVKAAKEAGLNKDAREIGWEGAAQVANLIGDRFIEKDDDWPDNPREAATRIRRGA